MPNPFYYGGHVTPDQFIGRKNELEQIFSGLEIADTGQLQSTAIVGPRRIGKSSLLYYLSNRYQRYLKNPNCYRVAYIDLQAADCKTVPGLLSRILTELGLVLPANPVLLTEFQNAIQRLKQETVYPVICLDEFEEITSKPQEFTPDFFDCLRSLMNANAIAFVTASQLTLGQIAAVQQLTSPFFNIFSTVTLGELTGEEAQVLLDRGLHCDRPFDEGDRLQILSLAGNHPYKIQLAGSLIYLERLNNTEVDRARISRKFAFQMEQVHLHPKAMSARIGDGSRYLLENLPKVPELVGRAFLESILRLKKDDVSKSTASIVGICLIVFLLLLAFGIIRISMDDLWKLIDHIRGTGK